MTMAMDGKALGDEIAALITDANAPDEMKQKIEKLWEEIAGAIVKHIEANAVVTVAAGIPVATSGSATSQTGATTSTGTGTIV
jgi:RNase H-fold protein (predicted Holliday junction resolvase)